MDGYEATRKIRALKNGSSKIRFVAMISNAMQGDREIWLAVGMDDYISKPVKIEELSRCLTSYEKGLDNAAFAANPVPNKPSWFLRIFI